MLACLSTTGLRLAAQSAPKKNKPLPAGSEFVRLLDPSTETVITRLTSLGSNSFLPPTANRFISTKDRFLLFSSDRTGRNLPFQLDLRTGAINQLGAVDNVSPQSLCLDPANRALNFLEGATLKEVELKSKRIRVLEEGVTAFSFGSSSADLFLVKSGKLYRAADQNRPLAEGVAGWCSARPGANGCLFGRDISSEEREFWYAPPGNASAKATLLAKGRISSPCWSADGRSVLFLRHLAEGDTIRSAIYEVFPETCLEQPVVNTSQFAVFSPNADGSVFVGARRSKAQPHVVLLLRASKRELTLCEHGSKSPARVSPVFSPDSRRVYFQSDREGKWAIYSVNVESLIEPT